MSLVGREREEQQLAALVASGGTLLIVGEPGLGKSALLRSLDGIGHNVPQEAPEAFTRAVLDVSR